MGQTLTVHLLTSVKAQEQIACGKDLPSFSDDAFLLGRQSSSIPTPLRSVLENESHSVCQAVHVVQAGLCQWTVASWRQRSPWSMPVGPSPGSHPVLRCLPQATCFLLFS